MVSGHQATVGEQHAAPYLGDRGCEETPAAALQVTEVYTQANDFELEPSYYGNVATY